MPFSLCKLREAFELCNTMTPEDNTEDPPAPIPSVVISGEAVEDEEENKDSGVSEPDSPRSAATAETVLGGDMSQLRLPVNPQLTRVIQQEVSAPNTPSLS